MEGRAKPLMASGDDTTRVTEIFVEAFYRDPVWAWAFPDPERRRAQHAEFWRLFVEGAQPHGWVWLTADRGAAALWLPPGCPELPPADEARLEPLLEDLLGAKQAELVLRSFGEFEEAHPPEPPHYYLSLLGTHPDHRGRGIGMGLLADNLAAIDAAGMPAYLESTNPSNNARYERLRFARRGGFELPDQGPPVTTMWREPGG